MAKYEYRGQVFEISEPKNCMMTVYKDGKEIGCVTAQDDGRFIIATDTHKHEVDSIKVAIDVICTSYLSQLPLSDKETACKQMEDFFNSNG